MSDLCFLIRELFSESSTFPNLRMYILHLLFTADSKGKEVLTWIYSSSVLIIIEVYVIFSITSINSFASHALVSNTEQYEIEILVQLLR